MYTTVTNIQYIIHVYVQLHAPLSVCVQTVYPSISALTLSQKAIMNSQSSYRFLGLVAFSVTERNGEREREGGRGR